MSDGISEARIIFTGNLTDYFLKNLETGKIPEWNEKEIMKKKFEEERKRIQPIYNSKGKIIEYEDVGRHVNFLV